jgi:uncharacterized protein DUF3443
VRMNLLAALIGMLCVVGCGGGGGTISTSSGSGTGTTTAPNVLPVVVDNGPSSVANSSTPAVNTLYATVTICVPGTTTCQTIDHMQVDTGSSGVRVISSVLTISLPLEQDANGNGIGECTGFIDGNTWGISRLADVKVAGEAASNQPVQIISDPAYVQPQACDGSPTTVANFGANGILGVGPFLQDCGSTCTTVNPHDIYYICAGPTGTTNNAACSLGAVPLSLQTPNPVASFTTDNNGVVVQLGAVNGTAASVNGSLIFGIGTQSNNGLGTAGIFTVDDSGELNTTYDGNSLTQSFIDSGSNAYFLPNFSSIIVCGTANTNPPGNSGTANNPGFFCPASTLNLSATISGLNGTTANVNFNISNTDTVFSTSAAIAADTGLGAPTSTISSSDNGGTFDPNATFDWGLPFYYGRSVYTAIEGQNTSAGAGPYFAF